MGHLHDYMPGAQEDVKGNANGVSHFNTCIATLHTKNLDRVPAEWEYALQANAEGELQQLTDEGEWCIFYPKSPYPLQVCSHITNSPSRQQRLECCKIIGRNLRRSMDKAIEIKVCSEKSADDLWHFHALVVNEQKAKWTFSRWKKGFFEGIGCDKVHIERVVNGARAMLYMDKGNGVDRDAAPDPEDDTWKAYNSRTVPAGYDGKDLDVVKSIQASDQHAYGVETTFWWWNDTVGFEAAQSFEDIFAENGDYQHAMLSDNALSTIEDVYTLRENLALNRGDASRRIERANSVKRKKSEKMDMEDQHMYLLDKAEERNIGDQCDISDLREQVEEWVLADRRVLGRVQDSVISSAIRDIKTTWRININSKGYILNRWTADGLRALSMNRIDPDIVNFLQGEEVKVKNWGSAAIYGFQATGMAGAGKTGAAWQWLKRQGLTPFEFDPESKFNGHGQYCPACLVDDLSVRTFMRHYSYLNKVFQNTTLYESNKHENAKAQMLFAIFSVTSVVPFVCAMANANVPWLSEQLGQWLRRITKWMHYEKTCSCPNGTNCTCARKAIDLSHPNGFRLVEEEGHEVLELSDYMVDNVRHHDLNQWGFDISTRRMRAKSAFAPNFNGV